MEKKKKQNKIHKIKRLIKLPITEFALCLCLFNAPSHCFEQVIIFNKWKGQVTDVEQEVIITNNNLLFHSSGYNNDLLVLKQWKVALNRIMPSPHGPRRRLRSSGIILYVMVPRYHVIKLIFHLKSGSKMISIQ